MNLYEFVGNNPTNDVDLFGLVNKAEWKCICKYPDDAVNAYEIQNEVLRDLKQRYGHRGKVGSGTGAIKHCTLACRFAEDLDISAAICFLDAHEDFPGNPLRDKVMDLHNNEHGLKIGVSGGSGSCIQECEAAWFDGRLRAYQDKGDIGPQYPWNTQA